MKLNTKMTGEVTAKVNGSVNDLRVRISTIRYIITVNIKYSSMPCEWMNFGTADIFSPIFRKAAVGFFEKFLNYDTSAKETDADPNTRIGT